MGIVKPPGAAGRAPEEAQEVRGVIAWLLRLLRARLSIQGVSRSQGERRGHWTPSPPPRVLELAASTVADPAAF